MLRGEGKAFQLTRLSPLQAQRLNYSQCVSKSSFYEPMWTHTPVMASKTVLLKTTSTQLTEHKEVKLVPTCGLHPYRLVLMLLEGIPHTSKDER